MYLESMVDGILKGLGEQLSTPGILGAVIILLCVAAETMMKDDKPLS